MIFDAESFYTRHQTVAIGLALLPHKVWMSGAENDVKSVRTGLDDTRHRVEHRLDAFVWRQKTEGQNGHLSGKIEFGLGVMCFKKRKMRYSVRYDLNLASRHVMNGTEEFAPFHRHDDDRSPTFSNPIHHV